MLACGATVEAAAQKAGVSRATVQRRMRSPDFQARLQEMRSDMLARAAAALTAAASEAIRTLLALLQPSVPHATRLGAARAIMELGVKMRQDKDFEERLAALERQLLASGPSAGAGQPARPQDT
jgi:hypothetical protein